MSDDSTRPMTPEARLERAREVVRLEARTIEGLVQHLGPSFSDAVDRILACEGQLVVTGVGKAGLIGQKISATCASTGTPSFFLNPTEALHGDLGRIRASDVLLVLSNSGESGEIKRLLPAARRIGATIVAVTGKPQSTLGKHADCVLEIGDVDEACPLGLAPTASTSAMLALGDALALVVMDERGFDREDYARFHPAGSLGRQLMRVGEIMRKDRELPLVAAGTKTRDTLSVMSSTPGKPGAALIVDGDGRLAGIFTDGDLRRLFERAGETAWLEEPIDEFMGRNPKATSPEVLVAEAEAVLKEYKIDQIAVLDEHHRPVGLLDVQDILDVRI